MGLTLSWSSRSSTPRWKIRSAAPCIFEGARRFRFGRLEGRHNQGDDEAPIQEAPVLRGSGASWSNITEKTGSDGPVLVLRGVIVRIAGNPRRVARPR